MTYWQQIPGIVGPAMARDFHRIGQQDTRAAIEDFVLQHSDHRIKFLDAGCNTGVTGYRLFQKGFRGQYHGVDSNGKALTFAAANMPAHPVILLQEDVAKMSFPDRHFDIVLCKDVIEHCEGYLDIVKELCRVTWTWLILSMFIKPGPAPDQIRKMPEGFYMNRYNRDGLLAAITVNGFKWPTTLFEKGEDEVLVFERQ